jgi:hypothetical protein
MSYFQIVQFLLGQGWRAHFHMAILQIGDRTSAAHELDLGIVLEEAGTVNLQKWTLLFEFWTQRIEAMEQ